MDIGIRLDSLVANRAEELKVLLDLDSGLGETERGQRLHDLLDSELRPVLDRTLSVDGLRALRGEGRLKAAAVRVPAIPILD